MRKSKWIGFPVISLALLAAFTACTLVPESTPSPLPTAEAIPATAQPKTATQEAPCPHVGMNAYALSVDGVSVVFCSSFSLHNIFQPAPGDIVQLASSLETSASPSIALLAVPFGITPATEALPAARAGIAAEWLTTLNAFRQSQNAEPRSAGSMQFFDAAAEGIFSQVQNEDGSFALIAEWTAEAGERAWLLRAVKTYSAQPAESDIQAYLQALPAQFSISSPNTSQPSVSKALTDKPSRYIPKEIPSPDNLPAPSWWSGECNVNKHAGSYYLGNSYRGVKACGPVGSAVRVNFGAGVTQLEWQCTELSKRYLYLAYGIPPYIADGNKIVNNYSGSLLVKIKNSTIGVAPQPGDVLSYGPNTTYGHTSIVSGTFVDASGNGYITVVEQNYSSSGTRKHTVKNWTVQDNLTITAWLHDPRGDAACSVVLPASPADGSVLTSPAIAFSWSAPTGCAFSGYTFRIKDTADMNSGGSTIFNAETQITNANITLDAAWLNKNLYWGVRASGSSLWVVRAFRVEIQEEEPAPPAAPVLVSPASGSTHTAIPQLCWQPGAGQTTNPLTYQVSLQGAANLQSAWLTQTCFTPPTLSAGTYLWSVIARDSTGSTSEASLSSMFVFDELPAAITVSTLRVESGLPIQVTWSRPNTNSQAWVGMFTVTAPDALPAAPEYLSGLSGTLTFTAAQPGSYDFRLFLNGAKAAVSQPVEVFVNLPTDPTATAPGTAVSTATPQPGSADTPISLPFYEKIMEWIDSNFITYFIKQVLLDLFK